MTAVATYSPPRHMQEGFAQSCHVANAPSSHLKNHCLLSSSPCAHVGDLSYTIMNRPQQCNLAIPVLCKSFPPSRSLPFLHASAACTAQHCSYSSSGGYCPLACAAIVHSCHDPLCRENENDHQGHLQADFCFQDPYNPSQQSFCSVKKRRTCQLPHLLSCSSCGRGISYRSCPRYSYGA